jgi:hypothetical protein
MPKEKAYVDGSRPHSNIIPCLAGPKAIFVCPSYQRFLRKLDNVANITIKSSMRIATTKSKCNFLFKDLPPKPINILGQES